MLLKFRPDVLKDLKLYRLFIEAMIAFMLVIVVWGVLSNPYAGTRQVEPANVYTETVMGSHYYSKGRIK